MASLVITSLPGSVTTGTTIEWRGKSKQDGRPMRTNPSAATTARGSPLLWLSEGLAPTLLTWHFAMGRHVGLAMKSPAKSTGSRHIAPTEMFNSSNR